MNSIKMYHEFFNYLEREADLDYESAKINKYTEELIEEGKSTGAKCYDCGGDLLYKESETDVCGDCASAHGEPEDYEE